MENPGDYVTDYASPELIEPSLYLRTDAGAADRFASAFDERFQVLARK
jgi:hypothetical protein